MPTGKNSTVAKSDCGVFNSGSFIDGSAKKKATTASRRFDRSVEVRRVTSEPSLDRAARDCSAPSDLTPVQSRSVQGEHPLDFLSRPHLRYAPNSISRPSGETANSMASKAIVRKGLRVRIPPRALPYIEFERMFGPSANCG